ncbi:MAG: MYXO-CTERM sorting domain-containing protein [Myxococcota bacterium]
MLVFWAFAAWGGGPLPDGGSCANPCAEPDPSASPTPSCGEGFECVQGCCEPSGCVEICSTLTTGCCTCKAYCRQESDCAELNNSEVHYSCIDNCCVYTLSWVDAGDGGDGGGDIEDADGSDASDGRIIEGQSDAGSREGQGDATSSSGGGGTNGGNTGGRRNGGNSARTRGDCACVELPSGESGPVFLAFLAWISFAVVLRRRPGLHREG